MLKVDLLQLFLIGIPEEFILISGIYKFSKKHISMFKCILLSFILAILIFAVRCLPIYFGVHTQIAIALTIGIICFLGDIPFMINVQNTFGIYFALALSEFLNLSILNLLNLNTEISTFEPLKRCLYGIPTLIFLSISIFVINSLLKKIERVKKLKGAKNNVKGF